MDTKGGVKDKSFLCFVKDVSPLLSYYVYIIKDTFNHYSNIIYTMYFITVFCFKPSFLYKMYA